MKPRNPGPVLPAPTLEEPAGELTSMVARCPVSPASPTGGLARPASSMARSSTSAILEFGHIHLDGSAHIPLTSFIAALLEDKGLGRTPYWSDAWITCSVRSPTNVAPASWMFQLAYALIRGASDGEVLDRISSRAGLAED